MKEKQEQNQKQSREPVLSRRKRFAIFLPVFISIVSFDLLTKYWVFSAAGIEVVSGRMTGKNIKTFDVIPGFFDLQCVLNPGAFSGIFGGQFWLLVGVSLVALVVIVAYLSLGKLDKSLFVLSLSFIASGTAGNLYDRYVHEAVRDFLHFFITIDGEQYSWPNFNVADMAICTGVILWFYVELILNKKTASNTS